MKEHSPPQDPDLDDLTITRPETIDHTDAPKKTQGFLLLFFCISLLLAASGYWSLQTSTGAIEVQLGQVQAAKNSSLQTIVLTASGYVVAQRQASVASKGTGRLKSLRVKVGDDVTAGQIIATLEQGDVQARLRQVQARLGVAQAALANAKPELGEARLNYQRVKTLWDKTFVTRAELETAEARLRRAKASVRSSQSAIKLAKAEIEAAQVDIENTIIRSPFDGVVIQKFAEVGEIVAPMAGSSNSRGSVLAIADFQTLQVETEVSESLLSRVHINQPVEIDLDAVPGHSYHGRVSQIVPTADRTKAAVPVKVTIQEADDRVLPEMSATVRFFPLSSQGQSKESAQQPDYPLTIPLDSVMQRESGPIVFGVYEGTISEKPIELGKSLNGHVQIRGDLQIGDSIVINPTDNLASGTRVAKREE